MRVPKRLEFTCAESALKKKLGDKQREQWIS